MLRGVLVALLREPPGALMMEGGDPVCCKGLRKWTERRVYEAGLGQVVLRGGQLLSVFKVGKRWTLGTKGRKSIGGKAEDRARMEARVD